VANQRSSPPSKITPKEAAEAALLRLKRHTDPDNLLNKSPAHQKRSTEYAEQDSEAPRSWTFPSTLPSWHRLHSLGRWFPRPRSRPTSTS
jgi:hypothetical protein